MDIMILFTGWAQNAHPALCDLYIFYILLKARSHIETELNYPVLRP